MGCRPPTLRVSEPLKESYLPQGHSFIDEPNSPSDGASASAAARSNRCAPLLRRNRSLLFNRGFDVAQVLQDGLSRHALEQKPHRDRLQSCDDALRLEIMRAGQRGAATALRNSKRG